MLNTKVMLVLLMSIGAVSALASSDPTRPPLFSSPQTQAYLPPLQLSMILSDSNNMRAIINEAVVGVSDTVDGAKVLAINEETVVVSRAGQRLTLRIPVAGVRKERIND